MKHNPPAPLCGPDCRYRGLYEGTQASLADMAARQADALGRVGRLRSGMIAAMKRSFGRQFVDTERASGSRMSQMDDEVVLAYLGSFFDLAGLPHQDEVPNGLEALRSALQGMGVDVPAGEDLEDWAKAVKRTERVAQGVPAGSRSAGSVHDDLAGLFSDELPPSPVAEAVPHIPQQDRKGRRRRGKRSGEDPAASSVTDLSDIFNDEPTPEPATASATAAEPKAPAKPSRNRPERKQAQRDVELPEPDEDSEPEPVLEDPFVNDESWYLQEPPAEDWGDEWEVPSTPKAPAARKPVPVEETTDDEDVWDVPVPKAGSGAVAALGLDDNLAELFEADEKPSRTTRRKPPRTAAAEEIVAPSASVEREEAPEVAPLEAPGQEASDDAPEETLSAPEIEAPPARRQLAAPIRPALLAPTPTQRRATRRGKERAITVKASSPDDRLFDVTPETGTEVSKDAAGLTDEIRQNLVAAVTLPRPMFMQDLLPIAGSPEVLAAWESQCYEESSSPVKFIAPKPRYKDRGALVLPGSDFLKNASREFTRSVWGECMPRYRGAKIYELGVFLYRFEKEVVNYRAGDSTVLLRLSQPRGLVGVVIALDTALGEDGATRAQVAADVDELLKDKLTLIVVLTTNQETLNPLVTALSEEARKRSWAQSAIPIIADRSWEYASSKGTQSHQIV